MHYKEKNQYFFSLKIYKIFSLLLDAVVLNFVLCLVKCWIQMIRAKKELSESALFSMILVRYFILYHNLHIQKPRKENAIINLPPFLSPIIYQLLLQKLAWNDSWKNIIYCPFLVYQNKIQYMIIDVWLSIRFSFMMWDILNAKKIDVVNLQLHWRLPLYCMNFVFNPSFNKNVFLMPFLG